MTLADDDLIHDLSDRLNSVTLSVELAIQLLASDSTQDAKQALQRVREDCSICAELVASLRQARSG